MSIAILTYQIVIAAIIVAGAFLKGRVGLKWATIAAVVWTLAHVPIPWLMLLQFITISIAYGIGNAIAGDEK